MTFIPFASGWRAGIAAFLFLLAGGVMAQAPDLQTPQSQGQKPRQSVQQQKDPQSSASKTQAEADRRFREMDRRLNRTLRSVCNGC
ncbi:hypothetical protein [Microvirga guangxiensis]|uniref:Uncharacterized protein n=1 Tax=Microvirga guangxiensis TaxID=549386 RepID=A0A1G5AWU4_9HYPH|nr:hypothetical protein [Microvirga guangxiensis]SCX82321.1 hypothetical protein SAMN02927923_00050 [Microvirga guangxiensis]